MKEFECAHSPREKMLAIDRLIHAFHWDLVQNPGRPVATNLLYAKNKRDILVFLATLAYGYGSTQGLREGKRTWERKLRLSNQPEESSFLGEWRNGNQVSFDSGSVSILNVPEVPVLILTGPVGVGKSTVASEAARLLREVQVSYALVDLPRVGEAWPPPADDRWNERLIHRNLASIDRTFARQVQAAWSSAPRGMVAGVTDALIVHRMERWRLRMR